MYPDEEPLSGGERRLSTDDLAGAPEPRPDEETVALLPPQQAGSFQARWRDIQTGFVDNPRDAVQAADALVAEVVHTLARSFGDRKRGLEDNWDRAGQIDTEELRQALRQYRAFFHRLLST